MYCSLAGFLWVKSSRFNRNPWDWELHHAFFATGSNWIQHVDQQKAAWFQSDVCERRASYTENFTDTI